MGSEILLLKYFAMNLQFVNDYLSAKEQLPNSEKVKWNASSKACKIEENLELGVFVRPDAIAQ